MGWVVEGAEERRVRNARQSARRRMPAATKPTPLGALAASWSGVVTSMANGGGRSVATEAISLAEVMMLLRGATRLTVWSSVLDIIVHMGTDGDCYPLVSLPYKLSLTIFAYGLVESNTTLDSSSSSQGYFDSLAYVLAPFGLVPLWLCPIIYLDDDSFISFSHAPCGDSEMRFLATKRECLPYVLGVTRVTQH